MPRPDGAGHRCRDWFNYAIVNALSEWFHIEMRHGGKLYTQEYWRGIPEAPLRLVGTCSGSGFKVSFKPDPAIFPDPRLSYAIIRDRLQEYAFLHSRLRFSVAEEATEKDDHFEFEDGIRSFVQFLNQGRQPLHPEVLIVLGKQLGITFQVGLQWCLEKDEITRSFVNDDATIAGGDHVTGLRDAVTRSINSFLRERGQTAVGILNGEEIRRGLTALVSVRMANPRFRGATKNNFISREAQAALATGVRRFLRSFFESNQEVAEAVVRAATFYKK